MGRRGWCGGITGFAKQSRHVRIDMNERVLKTELLPGDRLKQRIAGDYAVIELVRNGKATRIYSISTNESFGEGNRIFRALLTKLAENGNDEDRAWAGERVLDFDAELRYASGHRVINPKRKP